MLPLKTDPKWKMLLSNLGKIPVTGLATKMLMARMNMLLTLDQSEGQKQEAINAAFDFFSKNEALVKDDIKVVFG